MTCVDHTVMCGSYSDVCGLYSDACGTYSDVSGSYSDVSGSYNIIQHACLSIHVCKRAFVCRYSRFTNSHSAAVFFC